MWVSDYKTGSAAMHLAFLQLDTRFHLYLKLLDENNNAVIPRTFYFQVLNKDYEYIQ